MRSNAWLGYGYYFWYDEIDAIHWGHNSKKQTGYFEVYKADIECDNVLDTVFNEENYTFWKKQIEKAAQHIMQKTGIRTTLKEINQYFQERASWSDVADGILFQDLPNSEDLLVTDFNYRKRIQLVAYKLDIVSNFAFHDEWKCNKD
ncbi:hypothetical protein AGMMS4956_15580 [Bacteroidia bacterium]|nr:hypothetical protein AGMMS4956_15580 [Bacteroidia bacterium]